LKVHRKKVRKVSSEDCGELKILGPTHVAVVLEAMQEQNKMDRRSLLRMLERNEKDGRYLANVIDYFCQ